VPRLARAAEEARAANPERASAGDWRDFSAFFARIGREQLTAEPKTVTLYLADLMHRDRSRAAAVLRAASSWRATAWRACEGRSYGETEREKS